MATKTVTQSELDEFAKRADAHTSISNSFGCYDALVFVDGQDYHIWTEALNPLAPAFIKAISADEHDRLLNASLEESYG